MSETIYLVTGPNRGIGKGLTAQLLSRPHAVVIAAVRNPTDSNSASLEQLPKATGSRLIVIGIDASAEADPANAVQQLKKDHGTSHVDVIVANAGISKHYGPVATAPLGEVMDHFTINSVGSLLLFQAFWPLLQQCSKPIFVAVSTGLASIADMEKLPMPVVAYGSSKAALNYIVRKIHFEHDSLIAFVINPGWVQTDMSNASAAANGLEEAPVTLEASVDGILSKIDTVTREKTGGTFPSINESVYAW
nr:norsolorinic acid ketoreductase [Quercus suber]